MAAGYKQNELARLVHVSGTLIRMIESGQRSPDVPYKPPHSVMRDLSEVLNFDYAEALALAGMDPEPSPAQQPSRDLRQWTPYQLLSDLAQRFREAEESAALPAVKFDDGLMDLRADLLGRMNALANSARDGGDKVLAEALQSLIHPLTQQLRDAVKHATTEKDDPGEDPAAQT